MKTYYHRRVPDDAHPAGSVVTIVDDGKEYRYHLITRKERASFKAWATHVFAGGMNDKRLTGSWPHYTVRQPS